MRDWITRAWFPGWVGLIAATGCGGGVQRNLCYAEADTWIHEEARACYDRGYSWEECPDRPALLEAHKERQAQCP